MMVKNQTTHLSPLDITQHHGELVAFEKTSRRSKSPWLSWMPSSLWYPSDWRCYYNGFRTRRRWYTDTMSHRRTSTRHTPLWLRLLVVVSSVLQLLITVSVCPYANGFLLHRHRYPSCWKRSPFNEASSNPTFATRSKSWTSTNPLAISSSSSSLAAVSGGSDSGKRFATDDLTALKESVDLVSVVESYNLPEFKRTGHNRATCLCPFHDDHSPSLSIDGERRLYKCFACGAGGDVFQFVRQYNNQVLEEEEMTFYQAVRVVSQNFGQDGLAAKNILASTHRTTSTASTTGTRNSTGADKHQPSFIDFMTDNDEQQDLDKRKERILLANSAAAAFYSSCLTKPTAAGGARYHLSSRALSVGTLRTFAMGYAPDAYFSSSSTATSRVPQQERKWGDESLVQYLKSLGFTAQEICDAGLAIPTKRGMSNSAGPRPAAGAAEARAMITSDNKSSTQTGHVVNATTSSATMTDYDSLIDRFRHRIMVPIFDSTGHKVLGFGGREIPSNEQEEISVEMDVSASTSSSSLQWRQRQQEFKGPKYLNSPESLVFQKSQILFGQHLVNIDGAGRSPLSRKDDSKGPILGSDCVILVEGYMDVISLHTAGVHGVVASMGTAVTMEQLVLAAKLAIARRRALSGNKVGGGRLVICMDSDAAGLATVERLCSQGMLTDTAARVQNAVEIMIATLPKGMKDPADFVETRLLSKSDKDLATKRDQIVSDFYSLVVQNAQEWTDCHLERLLGTFDPDAPRGRPGSLGNVFDSIARFLAASMDAAARTRKAYEIAGSFAATITNSTMDDASSSIMRNQLEADLIRRAAKISEELEAIKVRSSRDGYQVQPQQGGMLARRSLGATTFAEDDDDKMGTRKRNGASATKDQTSSIPTPRNGKREERSSPSRSQITRVAAAAAPPLTPHVDGSFLCSKTDAAWMGLTKEGRLPITLGYDPRSTLEAQLRDLPQVQRTTAIQSNGYRERSSAPRLVYHNSNEYHGASFLTPEAELAGYRKGSINLKKYPELFENGVASLLMDPNTLASLQNAEDAVLRALVSNGAARTVMKNWLEAKSAVNADMVDLKWTTSDKEWLYTCLVDEMDSIPGQCNKNPRQLRIFLANREDCPLGAFVTVEEDTSEEDPSSPTLFHNGASMGTLDSLFSRDDGLPVDMTGSVPIEVYMQEILSAHVLASTARHAEEIRDELTTVATQLEDISRSSNSTKADAPQETIFDDNGDLAMRFQELTTELRDVTTTWREMKESMKRVNSRLMYEKTGLKIEGRMSVAAQMKLADAVDEFAENYVESQSMSNVDRYLPTDTVNKQPLADELKEIDDDYGDWANEDYIWTPEDAEKASRENSHLYFMELQDYEYEDGN